MARQTRRHRPEVLLYLGFVLSIFRPGSDAFYVGQSGRPFRAAKAATYHPTRPFPAAMKMSNECLGEPPFESIADLQALTVLRLKAELKMRGMKQNGKKADLVRTLANEPGVLTLPPPAEPSAETPAAVGNQAGAPEPERPPVPKKSQQSQPSLAVEEALLAIPGGTFASPIAAAVASEAIMDAELAQSPGAGDGETAGLEEEDAVHDLDRDEDDYSSSSSFGDEIEDPARGGQLPTGFHRINQRRPEGARPAMPELPPPTDDMRLKDVVLDLMERRETTFEREDDLESGAVQRSDVYTVYTKKALRPWDGPHADRAETHVVVLLSDVFGWGDSFTRSAADQVADVTDAIVLVPDMFRKRPWDNEQLPESYEAWRTSHDPDDVAADIRACVAYARSEYKPTSVGLMGFCFGGGKALEEAAAGVVKPDNLVVFYPTRYDIDTVASGIACPVAAFFAEYDVLPGATVEDARALREKLLSNEKVPDVQVKLCPGAGHGFAHRPMKRDKENAEDAMLLATSWLEMYLQKHFLPEPGGVKQTEFGFWELPS